MSGFGASDVDDGFTAALAQYACAPESAHYPERTLEIIKGSLLDTVGVTVAGRNSESVGIVRASAAGGKATDDVVTIVDGTPLNALDACLLDGTAAHALDFDHGAHLVHGHPGAVLWPAILAAAQVAGVNGRQILDAFGVALTVNAAVAQGMDSSGHYARGWHLTSSTGVFGAVAGVARLLGLPVEQTRCALGIAASMSAGSRQNFGTMTKALHAGLAARNGYFAALLARGGFTADQSQLEGPLGFFAMYSDETRLANGLAILSGESIFDREYSIGIKRFPCCYSSHRAATAALQLYFEDGIRADDVERIHICLEDNGFESLIHHTASNAHEGAFSGEYAVAAALVDGRLGLSSFTDAAVARSEIQRLISLTTFEERHVPPVGSPEIEPVGSSRTFYAVVTVETGRGNISRRVDTLTWDKLPELSRSDLEAKFEDCIAYSETGWNVDALTEQIWNLESVDAYRGLTLER